jgi:hypothetical protein
VLGVTIGVGPRYAQWAQRAAQEVMRLANLPVLVLGEADMQAHGCRFAHHLKFCLFECLRRLGVEATEVLYFDADAVMLRPWPGVRNLAGHSHLIASSSPRLRAAQLLELRGIAREQWFDSGLMILTEHYHRRMLEEGAYFYKQIAPSNPAAPHLKDLPALNLARHACGVPLCVLPSRYHFVDYPESTDARKNEAVFAHFNTVDSRDKSDLERYWASRA